jgi:hypothetical protein
MLVVSVVQEKALVLSLQVSQQAHYREGCLSLIKTQPSVYS